MLSVLIPVFAWDPTQLARDLEKQLDRSGVDYEILIGDDTPNLKKPAYQTELENSSRIVGFYRDRSVGRSVNRNSLAEAARYPYLLFIDGDAGIVHTDYITNYLIHLEPKTVLAGGTLYAKEKPADPAYELRWKYGRLREQSPAALRTKIPWKSFSTFNFLVPAEVFKKIRFNENIAGYGHEDTFFGFRLKEMDVSIVHLDNGLMHLGLEPASRFLEKVDESVCNLIKLYQAGIMPVEMIRDINLLKRFIRIRKAGLKGLTKQVLGMLDKSIRRRLLKPDPPLLLLDLYKLGTACRIA